MSEIKYGIIHEVGEYQEVIPVTEKENQTLNNSDKRKEDDKNKNKNR